MVMNKASKDKPVIGLVGGIGSGKSAAAAEFARLGCEVIDADEIGHALLDDKEVAAEIITAFSDVVAAPGGKVDRSRLSNLVFTVPAALARLDAIMHPRMRREIADRISAARKQVGVAGVVLDAAVLFEAAWDDLCDAVVFVSAPDEVRFHRISEGRGWSRDKWLKAEKSQIPLDRKAKRCDYTLDNSSSFSYLHDQIHQIFDRVFHS